MSETPNRHLGQQVGHYRLTRWLGKGGFADVYLGEHIYLKTQSAIKMLHVQLSEKNLQDFLHEAQIIAGLDHPNIVRVLDYGIEEGNPYLVMNYAPKGSIRRFVPRGTLLQPERILPLVQQIAFALDYAHQRRLIHRDVKPENMLVGQQEQVLLSDFGLVIVAQSSNSQTTRKMAGTVPYAAPEQLQGHVRFASDQYSLGVVTYEWLCGQRPFTGSFTEIASQHLLVPPPSLCQRVPGLSPLVEQTVFKALAKDPAQRYENVTAFANALRDAYQQAANPALFIDISTESLVPAERATTPTSSFHTLLQSDPLSDPASHQAQQAEAPGHENSPATPVTSASPLLATAMLQPPTQMPPLQVVPTQTPLPQVPPRRSTRSSGMFWRAALLVILIALAGVGGGIWYSTAHVSGRVPGQRQATSPVAGQSSLTSTARGTAQVTPGTTPAGTSNGNTPVPANGTPGTATQAASTPTQASEPTPTSAPDCLHGSSSNLTFTSLLGLGNPSPRTVTLINCGGSTRNWTSSATTNGGGPWLSANPSTGTITPNGREDVGIQATGNGLQIGIYKGTITFIKGSSTWNVTVTYTIVQA